MIQVDFDEQKALRAIQVVFKQIEYAAANALNDTAFAARDEERAHLGEAFIIRRPWVVQGIQVPSGGKATRDHLEASVVLEPTRDFLAKFEDGGIKSPRSGHDLAIPDAARPSPTSLIPAKLRPRNLQIADATTQGIGFRKKGGVSRGAIRQKNQGLLRTYLIERKGIFQRTGRGAGSESHLLYAFEPRARIPPDFHFEDTARRAASIFPERFRKRLIEALRTARL